MARTCDLAVVYRSSPAPSIIFFRGCAEVVKRRVENSLLLSQGLRNFYGLPQLDSGTVYKSDEKTGRMMCEKHRLQLDLFCESDGTFICPTCSFSSSHKGHNISTVEDLCSSKKSSVEAFVQKLTKLQTDLSLSAKSIEPVISNVKQVHSEFEEKVSREFNEMISRLQRRQEELLSLSRSIASSKTCELSKQLESITVGVMHVANFKSKFEAILKTGDPFKIIESCNSITVILRQIECKPENLTPCVSGTLSCRTDDIEPFKSKIPGLCYISTGPVLECIKEETTADARGTGGRLVALCGHWALPAKNQDIQVGVGESECTNVNIVTPGSVLTFTLPDCGVGCDLPVSLSVFGAPAHRPNDTRFSFPGPEIHNVTRVPRQGGRVTITGRGFGTSPREITVCVNGVMCLNVEVTHPHTVIACTVPQPRDNNSNQATLTLTVAGQHVSSTLLFDTTTWEWDTGCCGNHLAITPHYKSMVRKPVSSPHKHPQSTVTATTQLSDPDRVYEWQLSISDLKQTLGCQWVAYGLIPKPFDQNYATPCSLMYGWSTSGNSWNVDTTPRFQASGGSEDVMFRYDARTLTLTATWPRHNNATATVNNVPLGLYPAVNIHNHNTVKIAQTLTTVVSEKPNMASSPSVPRTVTPARCSVCHSPVHGALAPPASGCVAVRPSCGHPVCHECSGVVSTFKRDIPASATSSAHPPEPQEGDPPTTIEMWCPACACARDATVIQLQVGHIVKGEEEEDDDDDDDDGDGDDDDEGTGKPRGPCPKRRRGREAAEPAPRRGAPRVPGAVALCVACKADGVAANYMCVECTKASGGGMPMLYCKSCWAKAHWAPWMASHAKSDPAAAPGYDYICQLGTNTCDVHQLPLDVFCRLDCTFICARCAFDSHKGHPVGSVEDTCYCKNSVSPKTFCTRLSKLESDLNRLAVSIKSDTSKIHLEQSQFEETVRNEFAEMISLLQMRQDELISASEAIASSKVCTLSKQLEVLSAGLEHIEKYKSKCTAIVKSCNGPKIKSLCEAFPGILKQFECKKEHMTRFLSCVLFLLDRCLNASKKPQQQKALSQHMAAGQQQQQTKTFKCELVNLRGDNLPVSLSVFGVTADRPNDTRFSSSGPEITKVSEATCDERKVKITGHRFGTLPSEITVSVNGVLCSDVEVIHPYTKVTCTVPPKQDNTVHTLTVTVAGQQASSTLFFEDPWEWDTTCCGGFLDIHKDDKSIVSKSTASSRTYTHSTVIATTQLVGDRVHEWHLSISGLRGKPHQSKLVAFGVMPKPLNTKALQYSDMYGWTTDNDQLRVPVGGVRGTPEGKEQVILRYDPRTLTLTAKWPKWVYSDGHTQRETVANVPSGLYPAVSISYPNTVRISPAKH
ncbi:tripartite motif-containing protein 38 [Pelomyxa schiedti]|nr:tripartite motif-containing protein 38 [Pelomyxa schiedti]